jgi:hypothetical protein
MIRKRDRRFGSILTTPNVSIAKRRSEAIGSKSMLIARSSRNDVSVADYPSPPGLQRLGRC